MKTTYKTFINFLLLCIASVVLGSSSAQADLSDGFVHGFWFENNYADTMGTTSGTASNVSCKDGFIGQAGYFSSGSSSYLRLEDSTSTNFNIASGKDGKLTILCWYYPTSSGAKVLISNSDWQSGKNAGVVLDAQYNGGPYYNIADGSDRIDLNANKTQKNTWQFTAITADLSTNSAVLYYGTKDGTLQTSGTADISKIDTLLSSYKWYIGTDYHGYYYDGLIDEMGVWNRALSYDEINSIYTAQKTGTSLASQLALPTASVTAQAGSWTDASTWVDGDIPSVDADVEIRHAVTTVGRTINGTATIEKGGSLTGTGYLFLGHGTDQHGTLTINEGTNKFSNNTYIGFQGGTGELNVNGGTNTFSNVYHKLGELNVNSGNVTISGTAYLGYDVEGSTYNQTGGKVVVSGTTYFSWHAPDATINISGGSYYANGDLYSADSSSAKAHVNLSGTAYLYRNGLFHLGQHGNTYFNMSDDAIVQTANVDYAFHYSTSDKSQTEITMTDNALWLVNGNFTPFWGIYTYGTGERATPL